MQSVKWMVPGLQFRYQHCWPKVMHFPVSLCQGIFLRKNSSDLQHTGIKYLSIVNYHLQDVENLLSLLIFQVSNIMSGLHFTAFNAHHSMYIEVLYSCDRNSVILFMKLTAVIYPYEYLCFLNFECHNL